MSGGFLWALRVLTSKDSGVSEMTPFLCFLWLRPFWVWSPSLMKKNWMPVAYFLPQDPPTLFWAQPVGGGGSDVWEAWKRSHFLTLGWNGHSGCLTSSQDPILSSKGHGSRLLMQTVEKEHFPPNTMQGCASIFLWQSRTWDRESIHSDIVPTSTAHRGPRAWTTLLLGSGMSVWERRQNGFLTSLLEATQSPQHTGGCRVPLVFLKTVTDAGVVLRGGFKIHPQHVFFRQAYHAAHSPYASPLWVCPPTDSSWHVRSLRSLHMEFQNLVTQVTSSFLCVQRMERMPESYGEGERGPELSFTSVTWQKGGNRENVTQCFF